MHDIPGGSGQTRRSADYECVTSCASGSDRAWRPALPRRILNVMKQSAARRHLPNSPFNRPAQEAPPVECFDVGDRVSHDQFGLGRVLAVEGDNDAVLIDFSGRQGRILSPYSKLVKL